MALVLGLALARLIYTVRCQIAAGVCVVSGSASAALGGGLTGPHVLVGVVATALVEGGFSTNIELEVVAGGVLTSGRFAVFSFTVGVFPCSFFTKRFLSCRSESEARAVCVTRAVGADAVCVLVAAGVCVGASSTISVVGRVSTCFRKFFVGVVATAGVAVFFAANGPLKLAAGGLTKLLGLVGVFPISKSAE